MESGIVETLYQRNGVRVRYSNLDGYLYIERIGDAGDWNTAGYVHVVDVARMVEEAERDRVCN